MLTEMRGDVLGAADLPGVLPPKWLRGIMACLDAAASRCNLSTFAALMLAHRLRRPAVTTRTCAAVGGPGTLTRALNGPIKDKHQMCHFVTDLATLNVWPVEQGEGCHAAVTRSIAGTQALTTPLRSGSPSPTNPESHTGC